MDYWGGTLFSAGYCQLLASEFPLQCGDADFVDHKHRHKSFCLVEIRASNWKTNAKTPWIKENMESKRKIGVWMGEQGLILTTAHELSEQGKGIIRIRYRVGKKTDTAKLVAIDTITNLALLRLQTNEKKLQEPQKLQKLNLNVKSFIAAEDPPIGEEVELVSFGEDAAELRLQKGFVRLHQVRVKHDSQGTYFPVFQYIGGRSSLRNGVLVCGKRLCGFGNQENTNKDSYNSVSPSTLRRFLEWAVKPEQNQVAKNGAFISQGYRTLALGDQMRRKEVYQLPLEKSGALVISVYVGGSTFSKLKIHDIILSIGGKQVDNYGYYIDEKYGRLNSALLLSYDGSRIRREGERVKVEVLRAGKLRTLDIRVTSSQSDSERIPREIFPYHYFLENGILFVELTVDLLEETYGKNWKNKAILPPYLYQTRRFYDQKSDHRIIVIANVLPDESNQYLTNIQMQKVLKLNGERVNNLENFYQSLRHLIQTGEKTAHLQLFGGDTIFLDLENRNAINERIHRRYTILEMTSFDESISSSSSKDLILDQRE